jgi:mono/diheme cytochrome c family protein
MMKLKTKLVAALPVILLVLGACGGDDGGSSTTTTTTTTTTTSGGESYEGAITSTDTALGASTYEQHCNGCHPGGQSGYGPVVSGIAWTPARMREQIREGEGRMPGFSATDIDAPTLEALLAHLASTGAVANP